MSGAVAHVRVAASLGDVATSRLLLRRLEQEDVTRLAPVFAKPDVWRFPYGRGLTVAETQAFVDKHTQHWTDAGFGLWVAIERESDHMLGFVGLSTPTFLPEVLPAVEVGWRLDPVAWGNGYATEAATAALDEAFGTLGLREIISVPQSDNPASVRVAQRLQMRHARSVEIPPSTARGGLRGELFVMTRDEWLTQRTTSLHA